MSGSLKAGLPAGSAALLGTPGIARPRFGVRRKPPAPPVTGECATISWSRGHLVFDVHAFGARPEAGPAIYAFASRYGFDWKLLYVGRTTDLATRLGDHHKLAAAKALGATHILVRASTAVDVHEEERRLIRDLSPPLNESHHI